MSALAADLLPDGYTAWEQELARLSACLDAIDPSVIEPIWDAWRCPSQVLPWLAWAMSVDVWDEAWPETVKRQAIADSPDYHRRKGTRRAVEMMLDLSRLPYEITEWFDRVPRGRRGTAQVHVNARLDEVARVLMTIKPLVMTSKPKSRAIFFGAGDVIEGSYDVGGVIIGEEIVGVEPYVFAIENPEGLW
ncbi:MAG: phage tail protein I [Rhodoblastus sp.]|nr:MAG: phage tail protein I [Rhodoblastus sp.]